MRPEDVPAELLFLAEQAGIDYDREHKFEWIEFERAILAAVLPAHERMVREQVAAEIEAARTACPVIVVDGAPHPGNQATRNAMRTAAQIARGPQSAPTAPKPARTAKPDHARWGVIHCACDRTIRKAPGGAWVHLGTGRAECAPDAPAAPAQHAEAERDRYADLLFWQGQLHEQRHPGLSKRTCQNCRAFRELRDEPSYEAAHQRWKAAMITAIEAGNFIACRAPEDQDGRE